MSDVMKFADREEFRKWLSDHCLSNVKFFQTRSRACLKIHSHHLRPPLRGIFAPNSVNVARYASLIWYKSSTNWKTHLVKSNFQTRSRGRANRNGLLCLSFCYGMPLL